MTRLSASLRMPFLLALLLCAAGCSSLPRCSATGATQVLVVRRGWHIDVGFAVRDLDPPLRALATQFSAPRYVFFGFGDERYIRSSTHHGPALLAAIWPGRGVMLVTALDNEPQQAFGAAEVVSLPLTTQGSHDIQEFVWQSFAAARSRSSDALKPGPYADSLYFGARVGYSGLHTCNTWAAESLKAGGLPVRSTGVLLASQLWRQVRSLAPSMAQAPTPSTR